MDVDDCAREIVELHDFFERWFRGEVPKDDGIGRVATALASDFELISPRGIVDGRDAVLEQIEAAHGTRGPAFRIWTSRTRLRLCAPPYWLLVYEEHQEDAYTGENTTRISTTLLRERGSALEWVHVHETWLEVRGPDDREVTL